VGAQYAEAESELVQAKIDAFRLDEKILRLEEQAITCDEGMDHPGFSEWSA
jgi:hypothetical protein